MNTADLIELTVNILAQYRCGHLNFLSAAQELFCLGTPAEVIDLLLNYEDRKRE